MKVMEVIDTVNMGVDRLLAHLCALPDDVLMHISHYLYALFCTRAPENTCHIDHCGETTNHSTIHRNPSTCKYSIGVHCSEEHHVTSDNRNRAESFWANLRHTF